MYEKNKNDKEALNIVDIYELMNHVKQSIDSVYSYNREKCIFCRVKIIR